MKGFHVIDPSQGEYEKPEAFADNNSGLLSDNPAGDTLATALQNRRQKLAFKKIDLAPTSPEDTGEQ